MSDGSKGGYAMERWIQGLVTTAAVPVAFTVTIAAQGLRQVDFRWDIPK